MSHFKVLNKSEVSVGNQQIFDQLQEKLGFVPNIYSLLAHSEKGLADFLSLSQRSTSLNAKEKEVIHLATSQVNQCDYCLAAHTAVASMAGFAPEEIKEIRLGKHSTDRKLNALAAFTSSIVQNRGHVSNSALDAIWSAGYNEENVLDVFFAISTKMITNFLFAVAKPEVDFPAADAVS